MTTELTKAETEYSIREYYRGFVNGIWVCIIALITSLFLAATLFVQYFHLALRIVPR